MQARHLPDIPGLLRLDNPELGEGHSFGRFYSMEEAAECHVRKLKSLKDQLETPFTLMGMSMGGMLLSILATKFRSELPTQCQFRFLVTSPNERDLPSLPWSRILRWARALPRTPSSMEKLVSGFFGEEYRKTNAEFMKGYYRDTAYHHEQSFQSLVRQIHALRRFKGAHYFPQVNPKEAIFIGGGADTILGPLHNKKLKALVPEAIHHELPKIGHMIHLEASYVFEKALELQQL